MQRKTHRAEKHEQFTARDGEANVRHVHKPISASKQFNPSRTRSSPAGTPSQARWKAFKSRMPIAGVKAVGWYGERRGVQ